jgi:hypothetical protein
LWKPVANLLPFFATGINDTGSKFATGVVLFFATGINDTSGKFATSVVDTGGK